MRQNSKVGLLLLYQNGKNIILYPSYCDLRLKIGSIFVIQPQDRRTLADLNHPEHHWYSFTNISNIRAVPVKGYLKKDNTHPHHSLLPSGKVSAAVQPHHSSSFFPRAVRPLNSSSALHCVKWFVFFLLI